MIALREVTAEEWPGLSGSFADLGFEQSLTYGQAAAARIGGRLRLLALEQAGRPVAAAAVRLRLLPGLGRGIAWIPSGPLLRPADASPADPEMAAAALAALRGQLVDAEGHILRFRLSGMSGLAADTVAEAAREAGFTPTQRAASYRSFALDLRQDEAALMKALQGKWRTDLRHALKSGLELAAGESPDLQTRFLQLFAEVQGAKGFRPEIPPEFHFALSGTDFPRRVLLATRDGADIAGIVTGAAGATATYLFGATVADGRRFRAGYFLTWEGIRHAREDGRLWYDLGGVDFEANPDVARFKERMNGLPILAEAFEARPPGAVPALVAGLERLRARLRRRNR